MARSIWEDATPEARRGLKDIKQYVGATPGKRTGPGSPGYIPQRGLAPARQASIGRRLEAKTKMDIARMNRDTASENRKSLANLQEARFAQDDKMFERNLETGNFGRQSSGSRRLGVIGGNVGADAAWKYGGKDPISETPTYRTSSAGMQLYTPESVDPKTGVVTPGRFGETIGGPDVPVLPKEGTGTVTDRPGDLQYSQNVFQRKEKRPDGSDRFVFTNIGTPNAARGDRNITNESGGYDREMMHLPWREGIEDKNIAKAAAIEKAGMIAKKNALENIPSDLISSRQDEMTKAFPRTSAENIAAVNAMGTVGKLSKMNTLEKKFDETLRDKNKDRWQLIDGEWVDTQAGK